jgi:hypothetical protein
VGMAASERCRTDRVAEVSRCIGRDGNPSVNPTLLRPGEPSPHAPQKPRA